MKVVDELRKENAEQAKESQALRAENESLNNAVAHYKNDQVVSSEQYSRLINRCALKDETLDCADTLIQELKAELTELRTEHADLIQMRSALLDLYDKQEDELTELREVVRKQEGYVLAPLEATDKMAMAALTKHRVPDRWISNVKRIYKAMIAASKEEKR